MDTFLSVVLWNAAGATLLAVLVAALGLCRRWPALTHSLWLLVLLKLIAPPLFVLPLPLPPADVPKGNPPVEPSREPVEVFLPVALPVEVDEPVEALPPDPALPAEAAPEFSWQTAAGIVLLAGCGLWWLVLALRVREFRWVLRRVRPAPDDVQGLTNRLAGRLGLKRAPAVGFVEAPISPLLWGLALRPRLLLPAALWARLGEAQRETLLVHELAHLRRRDHWVRVLELVVLSLYWWHPVAWWARARLQQAEEQCCDAWVVWALPEKAQAYATALVEAVAFLSQSRSPVPAGASGIGKVRFLKRRLTMILRDKAPRGLTWGGLLAVLVLAVFLLPLAAAPAGGNGDPLLAQTKAEPAERSGGQTQRAADPNTRPEPRPPVQQNNPLSGVEKPSYSKPEPRTQTTGRPESQYGPGHPVVVAEIQKLRDQIELLEVQVQVKSLQVEAARLKFRHTKDDLGRASALAANRAISEGEMSRHKERYENAELEMKLKEAELREPMVLLQQARRRLASLEGTTSRTTTKHDPRTASEGRLFWTTTHDFGRVARGTTPTVAFLLNAPPNAAVHIREVRVSAAAVAAKSERMRLDPGQSGTIHVVVDPKRFLGPKTFKVFVQLEIGTNPPKNYEAVLTVKVDSYDGDPNASPYSQPAPDNSRVRDLENKVDRLLKEMEELRKEMKARPPSRGPNPLGDPVLESSSDWLAIPFHIDPARQREIDRVLLFTSQDEGRTWRQVAEARPSEQKFRFRATEDGEHWFAVSTVDAQGNRSPADPANYQPALKVSVKGKRQ